MLFSQENVELPVKEVQKGQLDCQVCQEKMDLKDCRVRQDRMDNLVYQEHQEHR